MHLRKETRGVVKTQAQPPQEPDADGATLVEVQLMAAAEAVRHETFPARSGDHCDTCDFLAICPVRGAGTVLS